MTEIFLVSDDSELTGAFQPISKSKKYHFECISWSEWNKRDIVTGNQLIYFNISDSSKAELKTRLKSAENLSCPWGIVDSSSRIEDIASLFHNGCCDYIDTTRLSTVKVARIGRALAFSHERSSAPLSAETRASKTASYSGKPAKNWNDVVQGKEYTFCFMYVELLPSKEWSKKAGDTHQEQMQTAFHDMIETQADNYNGKIWMWNEWKGLLLFPFDGKECEASVLATRLLINRLILSIEGGPYHTLLNYKIAMHIGSTVYQERGNTGTIVADDINFIFHLGSKYADPNRLYVSSQVRDAIRSDLQNLFRREGQFEGQSIYTFDSSF
ncbi:MAG: hypothetical protein K9L66_01380 [Spirochaetaceae bacterium]|nr:hypothetical protein [Spirochaetaceae bacterium]MCF7947227.1 hypothetical protein [Spirochaetia bacterium]MCF7950266.1 hypothetical protein [Spirochaetaceae bacterium]